MLSPSPNLWETNPSDPNWHTLTIDRTLAQLDTDDRTGLTEPQIIDRQQEFSANELVAAASRQWWQILLDQFTNILSIFAFYYTVPISSVGLSSTANGILISIALPGFVQMGTS
jgi:magnesium-transporting ATPase (P-type)